jgi:hypothetical protein
MESMIIYLISLRYNMAHVSHLLANYKLFEGTKYRPVLLLNKNYENLEELIGYEKVFYNKKQIYEIKDCSAAIFWFPSVSNVFVSLFFKIKFRATISYVYHEPFDSIRNYYESGFSILDVLKKIFITITSDLTSYFSDSIILPSMKAISLYKSNFIIANKNYNYIPLLFDDELNKKIDINKKIYISFIGTVSPDHSFDSFLKFILHAIQYQLFSDFVFLIATKSDLSSLIENNPNFKKGITKNQIVISHGSYMSNSKINRFFYQSLIVWNAYSRSTQSGVLPKAYMFGCSVLVLKKNSNEFLENYKTGVYVEDNNDVNEIGAAVKDIVSNKGHYVTNSRDFFLRTFYYKNLKSKFLTIFK